MVRALPLDPRRPGPRNMPFRAASRFSLPIGILVSCLLWGGSPAHAAALHPGPQGTMSADSVKAGMTGYGLSVFAGTSVDSFPMTILGVLKGNRPGADLILARAKGDFLERTGIIAGMSGSPVYIGGKLIGAVSYTWSFTKDPIAGLTPIGEMLGALGSTGETSEPKLASRDP